MISIVHTIIKEATKMRERVVSLNSRNQRVRIDLSVKDFELETWSLPQQLESSLIPAQFQRYSKPNVPN